LAPYDVLADSEEAVDMGSDERACGSGLDVANGVSLRGRTCCQLDDPFFSPISPFGSTCRP
jgi:hypothetical protein